MKVGKIRAKIIRKALLWMLSDIFVNGHEQECLDRYDIKSVEQTHNDHYDYIIVKFRKDKIG